MKIKDCPFEEIDCERHECNECELAVDLDDDNEDEEDCENE